MTSMSWEGWSNKEYLHSIWKKVRDIGAFVIPGMITMLETHNPFMAFAASTLGVAVVSVVDFWFSS